MEIYHPTCRRCGHQGCNCPKPRREDYDRLVREAVDHLNEVNAKRATLHVVKH